jgi:uncharacterized protein
MLDWLYYLLLLIVSIAGLFVTILGLPGLWLMVAALGGFALLTSQHNYVGWPSIITLVAFGLIAEVMELFASAAGSKAAGGRKRGMVGAVVGAMIGGIAGSVLIPVPIIGTIVGACLGAFVGAAVLELTDRDFWHAMRVGAGAAKGRLMGIVIKLTIGVAMLIIIIIAALPI